MPADPPTCHDAHATAREAQAASLSEAGTLKMHVLVTGAGGLVGATVAEGLAASGHSVRAHDIRSLDDINPTLAAACSSVQQSDLSDFDAVLQAVRGVDAVVHLGGSPGVQGEEDPAYAHVPPNSDAWATILRSNVEGTRNIFEAAAQLNVKRVVYASRAGLLSPYPWALFRSIELPIKPVGNYSCSKAMGEALSFSYASTYPMDVVVVRIGNYRPARERLTHPHQLGKTDPSEQCNTLLPLAQKPSLKCLRPNLTALRWLAVAYGAGRADCLQLFEQAISHPLPDTCSVGTSPDQGRHAIVFGVSGCARWKCYDLEHGRRVLGYWPTENADVAAEDIGKPPEMIGNDKPPLEPQALTATGASGSSRSQLPSSVLAAMPTSGVSVAAAGSSSSSPIGPAHCAISFATVASLASALWFFSSTPSKSVSSTASSKL